MGSAAMTASRILNLAFRMGSSHSGPSRHPHWKPWTMLSRHALSRFLSTCEPREGEGGWGRGASKPRDSVSTRRGGAWRGGSGGGGTPRIDHKYKCNESVHNNTINSAKHAKAQSKQQGEKKAHTMDIGTHSDADTNRTHRNTERTKTRTTPDTQSTKNETKHKPLAHTNPP